MDSLLAVVFDSESMAFDAKKALHDLAKEKLIIVFDQAVVERKADGSTIVTRGGDLDAMRTLAGAGLGFVLGLTAGPAAAGIGAAAGLAAGAAMDVNHARICGEFIEEVKRKLTPGKFALVAEVSEDSASPVDLIMKGLGGTAFRRALKEVRHAKHVRKVRAIKAELARIKAEQAGAHANRKAKFGKKLNQLDSKIQSQLENRKRRRGAAAAKEKAQSKALQAKAARMKADASVKPL